MNWLLNTLFIKLRVRLRLKTWWPFRPFFSFSWEWWAFHGCQPIQSTKDPVPKSKPGLKNSKLGPSWATHQQKLHRNTPVGIADDGGLLAGVQNTSTTIVEVAKHIEIVDKEIIINLLPLLDNSQADLGQTSQTSTLGVPSKRLMPVPTLTSSLHLAEEGHLMLATPVEGFSLASQGFKYQDFQLGSFAT